MIRRDDIRKLNKFDRIYILVSGGKDSTYTTLQFKEHENLIKKPIYLLHHNTGNRLKTAVDTLNKLIVFTEWPIVVLESKNYSDKTGYQIVLDSFQFLDKAKQAIFEGKYSKKIFPCCYWLKKRVFEKWLKEEDHSNDCFVLSIKPGDGSQRQTFLNKLRNKSTFFWMNRRRKVMYFYPLRDTKKETIKTRLLKDKTFWETQTSGCRICPILLLFDVFEDLEPKRVTLTKQHYQRNFISIEM